MASPVGGLFVFGPPAGSPAVTLGINNGSTLFPAAQAGNFNIEVFTATGLTTLPTLDSGFQAGALDPGGALTSFGTGSALTGNTLTLFSGNYAVSDVFLSGSGSPATVILGSGNQTVVGSGSDTLQGGSGSQILNGLTQRVAGAETILGGSGATTVFGGPGDSVVAGAGSTYVDGTAGNMKIRVGSGGTDSIVGNAATNTISGASAGPDTLSGGAAAVQVQGLGKGDIVSFGGQTGNASINATIGNIAATLGGGAATLFGGSGDTVTLGSVGQYLDAGAGKMTVQLGSGGTDSVFGASVAGGGNTILGGAATLSFNPQAGGSGDLINLSGGSGNATVNVFSAGGTQLAAVNDTVMAGTGSDSVWGGPGDRIGVGTSTSAGGTHTFDHSTTVTGAAIAFGTNDSVTAVTYGGTPGAVTVGAGASSAKVTVTTFNTATDSLFYQNETAATTSNIVATSTSSGGNTTFTLPDGTVMTLIGVAAITSGMFKP